LVTANIAALSDLPDFLIVNITPHNIILNPKITDSSNFLDLPFLSKQTLVIISLNFSPVIFASFAKGVNKSLLSFI
jgi:hypothetical protein